MAASIAGKNGAGRHWVAVLPGPAGQFSAELVGVPQLRATAATREAAVQQVCRQLDEWLASGQLVPIEVPNTIPLLSFWGHLDPNDPLEQEFVEELARRRREDLERTLEEDYQECSNSSSTPTM